MKRSAEILRMVPLGTKTGRLGVPSGWMPSFSSKKIRQGAKRLRSYYDRMARDERRGHLLPPVSTTLITPRKPPFWDRIRSFIRRWWKG